MFTYYKGDAVTFFIQKETLKRATEALRYFRIIMQLCNFNICEDWGSEFYQLQSWMEDGHYDNVLSTAIDHRGVVFNRKTFAKFNHQDCYEALILLIERYEEIKSDGNSQ